MNETKVTNFSKGIVWNGKSGYQGKVSEGGVGCYWGIPYAKPPVGRLRFEFPEKLEDHTGLYYAFNPGPISYQYISDKEEDWKKPTEAMSEDCLYLNIFTPAKVEQDRLPVLFWIHGGASIEGRGSDPVLDGSKLAERGIVVVTFNHRLGALGFLAHPELTKHSALGISGNYGVMDILMALEWVCSHIEVFGGDPNHIVMGGQSAGAGATAYLMMSPLLKVKLKGAILLSTSPFTYDGIPYSLEYYEQKGKAYMDKLGIYSYEELKTVPVGRWVHQEEYMNVGGFSFLRDGYIFNSGLKESFAEGKYQKVPMILGMTRDESSLGMSPEDTMTEEEYKRRVLDRYGKSDGLKLLNMYPVKNEKDTVKQYKLMVGGESAVTEIIHTAKALSKYQKDIYLYRFDRKVPRENGDFYGAMHCDDLPYVFGTFGAIPYNWTEEDIELSEYMMKYISQFVKTGNPNESGVPEWNQFVDNEELMLFGADASNELVEAMQIPNKKRIELLEKIRNF